jgi:hypothetical protein
MPRAHNALSPQAVLTGLLRYLEGSDDVGHLLSAI